MNDMIDEYLDEVPYMEYTYLDSYYSNGNLYINVKKNYKEGFEISRKYDKDPQSGIYIFSDVVKSEKSTSKFNYISDKYNSIYMEFTRTYFNEGGAIDAPLSSIGWNMSEEDYSDERLSRFGFKKFGFEGALYSVEPEVHYWVDWEVWAKFFIFRYSKSAFVADLT